MVAGAKGQRLGARGPHCPISACYLTDSGPQIQRTHQAQVAFRCVRPGSYTPGPPSVALREPPDLHFSPAELEWVTKEKGATLLCPAGTGGVRARPHHYKHSWASARGLGMMTASRSFQCPDMHGAQPGRCTGACGQAPRLAGKRSLAPCPGLGRPSLRGEGAVGSPAADPRKPSPCTGSGEYDFFATPPPYT